MSGLTEARKKEINKQLIDIAFELSKYPSESGERIWIHDKIIEMCDVIMDDPDFINPARCVLCGR